ncbi:IS1634 family transposase [Oscillatoria sp. FACHB-1406]|nr:IS1634 family transposase [Oscillatoria sp. FACHB-1406]
MQVALALVKKYDICTEVLHLDSSSFHVHGEYNTHDPLQEENLEPRCIEITYGYSRDHRPDLKQFTLDLICSGDGDIPLWLKTNSGNASDSQQFAKILQQFKKEIDWESLFVADCAFYSRENLALSSNLKWLTRVPLTVKAAQKIVNQIPSEELIASDTEGYRYSALSQNDSGIEQRWLLVESEKRRESDLKKLNKNFEKAAQKLATELRQLSRQTFACIPDARQAAQKLFKKAKYHQLGEIKIEEIPPSSKKQNQSSAYRVTATAGESPEKLAPLKVAAGRFILATNVLDEQALSHEEMLSHYKGQQAVERGFRFLKDPMFLTDSVFLKSPQRIEALGLIMGLCLLVYSLGQRQLRSELQRREATVPNQLGRPTQRPTLRWIFQCFQAIHVFDLGKGIQVSNLNEERLLMLKFFPPACQRYYLVAE